MTSILLTYFLQVAIAGSGEIGGYFRVMTRPDLQGGAGKLGFWNISRSPVNLQKPKVKSPEIPKKNIPESQILHFEVPEVPKKRNGGLGIPGILS